MPGDVLSPVSMHMSGMMSSLDPVSRPHTPRSIISEHSPLKKRRVGGSFSYEYEHRYSSRSGGLALLRVLTAPSSPTADLNAIPSPSVKAEAQQWKAKKTMKAPSPSRLVRVHSQPTSSLPSATSPRQHSLHSKTTSHARNTSTASMTSQEAAPASPEPMQLKAARALAGQHAIISERYLPPTSLDDVSAYLDPEFTDTSAQASLKSQLKALATGQSMVVVYPTEKGAATFNDQILGPGLDPVLRRAVNTHGLRPETAAEIRNMEAVDGMLPGHDLLSAVESIVDSANMGPSANGTLHVTSSVITTAQMSPEYWKYQWLKQERRRIRKIVEAGLGNGGASVEMAGISVPMSAVRVAEDMMDGLKSQKVEEWEGTSNKELAAVEVGIFVITNKATQAQ